MNDNGAKLWDNDELVLTALKVYGKHPRPQCFNEISRVCKLSNLRKSRYFHEKMMKNNPYEKKMRKLLAEEGEEAYPFFKIFFEEYKTKKERQKLMNYEEDKMNNMMNNKSTMGVRENSDGCVDNSNEMPSQEEFYDGGSTSFKEENYEDYGNASFDAEYHESANVNDDNDPMQFIEISDTNLIENSSYMMPMLDTNAQYLENLELKLKILNREKETMSDYFETFSNVIDNLKGEIEQAKAKAEEADLDVQPKKLQTIVFKQDSNDLAGLSVDQLHESFEELNNFVNDLNASVSEFAKDQANFKADLKVTKNFARVENKKLKDELNEYQARLSVKDEEIADLKKQLEESMRQSRSNLSKHAMVQSNAGYSNDKLGELKESLDRLFAQIQSLN